MKHTDNKLHISEHEDNGDIVLRDDRESIIANMECDYMNYKMGTIGSQKEIIKANAERIVKTWNSYDQLINALQEITKGEGAYNPDQLKHASNCIENMKSIAIKVLKNAE